MKTLPDKNVKNIGDEAGEKSPLDMPWPKLRDGQQVEFMGCPFVIHRLNASNLCLRPATGRYSARKAMDRMRA